MSRRDTALDVVRGFGMVAMIAAHVGPLSRMTAATHLAMSVGAADIFVLVSGVTIGLLGAARTADAIRRSTFYRGLLRKAGWLWLAHVCMTLVVLRIRASTGRLDAPDVDALGGWGQALVQVATLRVQPLAFMNILPLYVLFIGAAPAALEVFRRGGTLPLFLASAALWLVAQARPSVIPLPRPDGGYLAFSIAAWQFAFVLGLLMGHGKAALEAWWARHPRLLAIATGLLLALFTVAQFQRRSLGRLGLGLPEAWRWWLAKESWAPARAVYAVLFVACLYTLAKRWLDFERSAPAGWLIVATRSCVAILTVIGRQSLRSFLLHLPIALAASALGIWVAPRWLQEIIAFAAVGAVALAATVRRPRAEARPRATPSLGEPTINVD